MLLLLQQNHFGKKSSMLDYCKLVLEKVHFDPALFQKEYQKSLRWLSEREKQHLQQWLTEKFGTQAPSLSRSCALT